MLSGPLLTGRAAWPFLTLHFGAGKGSPNKDRETAALPNPDCALLFPRLSGVTICRRPERGGNTRSHPEHGSEGPHRRGYCGIRPRESRAPPAFYLRGRRPKGRRPLSFAFARAGGRAASPLAAAQPRRTMRRPADLRRCHAVSRAGDARAPGVFAPRLTAPPGSSMLAIRYSLFAIRWSLFKIHWF